MARTTKTQIENMFTLLCDTFGKEQANQYNDVGKWFIYYGDTGMAVAQVRTKEGGIEYPFGYEQRKPSAFWDWCHATVRAVEVFSGKSAHEIWREHAAKKIILLWSDLTEDEWFTLETVAKLYDSGDNLETMACYSLTKGYNHNLIVKYAIKAYHAGVDDGADAGTIPLIGGRLLEKWEQTKAILRLKG